MSKEAIRREPVENGLTHQDIPQELAILPLFNVVVYPQTVIPLAVAQEQSVRLIDDAMAGPRMVGLVTLKSEERRPEQIGPDDFYQIGTAAVVHRLLRLPDNTLRVAIQGVERIQIEQIVADTPYYRARVRVIPDQSADDSEIKALMRHTISLAGQILLRLPNPSEELHNQIANEEDPRRLAYLLALTMLFRSNVAERQNVLEQTEVREKLVRISAILTRELEVLRIGQEIQTQIQSGMDKDQREYALREQLRAIRRELGEDDQDRSTIEWLRQALAQANLSEEAQTQAQHALERLAQMPPAASEYGLIRTYLETLAALPWQRYTEDQLDLAQVRRVLDEDHYGRDAIKTRILEYLAVRQLRLHRLGSLSSAQPGAILCFVGPPGVGKTSLARSIARALGRNFLRIALGGVRDAAEIRGQRRNSPGALPSTILQALRRTGVANPVCMLDEIDQLGANFQGDPSTALLEVLDPEQNSGFRDHYLDVAWDLAPVLFIAAAHTLQNIPAPLLDRMEVIPFSGYSTLQKLAIARRYLVPEQLRAHALVEADLTITDAALQVAIEEYTREAGVRNLERAIGALCRKAALEVATRAAAPNTSQLPPAPIIIAAAQARHDLGRRRYHADVSEPIDRPGIVTGLVWTALGGDCIAIEATAMVGGRNFQLTGQHGESMRDAAQTALSFVRAESARLAIDPHFYATHDIHLHVPAGALAKDGPATGVAMVTALASLLTGRLVHAGLAMTGAITLRGRVVPVGGLTEKVLAAHRVGLHTIILPRRNAEDLENIPTEVRAELTLILVDRVEEVLAAALQPHPSDRSAGAPSIAPQRQET